MGPCSLLLLHVGAADNDIGAQGAKALADSLAPRQNPDGTWAYNNTLRRLELNSAPSLPAQPSLSALPRTPSASLCPSVLSLLFCCPSLFPAALGVDVITRVF